MHGPTFYVRTPSQTFRNVKYTRQKTTMHVTRCMPRTAVVSFNAGSQVKEQDTRDVPMNQSTKHEWGFIYNFTNYKLTS